MPRSKTDDRLDILVIGARGIPNVEGGAEKHAEMTFPIFAEHGYSVRVVGLDRYIKQKHFKGVELRGLPTIRFANTDKIIYHFLAFLYAAWTRPKVVHLQGLNSALFLVLYKLCGLKVVVRYGSSDHQYGKWGVVGRMGFRLCERQISSADCVVAVSKKYKHELQDRYGLQRLEVIPNGIDRVQVSEEAREFRTRMGLDGSRYVLAVGRITVDKDYDTLVQAVHDLSDKDVRLVVAGGPSEDNYAARFLGLRGNRVRFLGRIERRLLSALYEDCAVFVNSSLHEGLCNAILEAISYGKPVIASNIPANLEMGLREQSYFPVKDAAALTRKIEAALGDPAAFVADKSKFVDWFDVFVRTERVYQMVVPSFAKAAAERSIGRGSVL